MRDPSRTGHKYKNQQGFTLIELLAVISIISLLSSSLLVAVNNGRIKARNARRVADISDLSKSFELYFSNCDAFPQLPPATTGIKLDASKLLYLGTRPACGNHQGTPVGGTSNGGIGNAANPGVILISKFTAAPLPVDDGNLPAGNRCSENNTQLSGSSWNEYVYHSVNDFSRYYVYFCIGQDTGQIKAGRHILTEKGIVPFTGNFFP